MDADLKWVRQLEAGAKSNPPDQLLSAGSTASAGFTRGWSVVPWMPISLTAGIWTYFALPKEPQTWSAVLLLAVALATGWRYRSNKLALLLALILVGFGLAKLRAELVATPLITARTAEVVVIGVVERATARSPKRSDLLLGVEHIEGLSRENTPRRLRLTVFRPGEGLAIGNRLSLHARLAPLPGPAMPGSFDFGRQLYFSGIGGTGRVTGGIQVIGQASSLQLLLDTALSRLRESINGRIAASLPPQEATVAAALITGERAQIPKATNLSLQISGLAHILSISGLHMSLAAGGMFWLVRALLALSPALALGYPIKKWAAVTALIGGFVYMLLAGSGAATQRSYIMVAVMLFALIVDRQAVSLRNLAVAAMIILVLQPESAIEASFQMSFMAVLGLAAFFEWWSSRGRNAELVQINALSRIARHAAAAIAASVLTSVVAGAFSSIPAAYHFGRVAPYGVLSNGLAIPVVSFLVMPSALLAIILMPFGLEALPLAAVGYGLQQVLRISDWVASLPGARHVLPQMPPAASILLALGAVSICLLQKWHKAWGGAILVAGFLLAQFKGVPDLLIERTGANAAFRNEMGELVFARQRSGSFAAGRWLQANGEETALRQASVRPGWICKDDVCRAVVKGKGIAYLTSDSAIVPPCGSFDILISAVPLRGRCRNVPVRIDRFDLWKKGAHAVQIGNTGVSTASAASVSGERPWVVVPTPRTRKK